MKLSLNRITGVMYWTAMRQASIAISKASAGREMAMTGIGVSPLRPRTHCRRSDCSTLVGMPVEGPARWMSTMTSGYSAETARPIASVLSASPGPEVEVTPSVPANEAPIATQIAAISSSAWTVTTSWCLYAASSSRMVEAGVIGYEPSTSRRFARLAPATSPIAQAWLPMMLR